MESKMYETVVEYIKEEIALGRRKSIIYAYNNRFQNTLERAEKYAFEKGYALETFACLAMNKRIDDMQIGMHVVTIGEIKNLVDDAIAHAEKKKFGRSLSRKRTNSEGMVLLLEQDFEGK